MSGELRDQQVARLREVAAVLVPGRDDMPAPAQLPEFDSLLQRASSACGWSAQEITDATDSLPSDIDWESTKGFESRHPAAFKIVSTLACAAYFMSPRVLELLRYPTNRRHPAGLEEFANEFESGIMEPMLTAEPRFRDTRD